MGRDLRPAGRRRHGAASRLLLGSPNALGAGVRGCRLFFFFQAEDGIRDLTVTGVQTCALPISRDFRHYRYVPAAPFVGRCAAPCPGSASGEFSCHPLRRLCNARRHWPVAFCHRSEEHTSELQSQSNLVCRLLLEKKKQATKRISSESNHKPTSLMRKSY